MFTLKAKDVMTKDIISVKKDTPIREAAELLVKHNISGMPVVEDDMTLAGVLSEKDAILIFYETKENIEKKTVADFMTQPAFQFDEEKNLLDVCDFLVKNIFRRVPITSNKKLVGIISIKNVIETALQPKQESPCSD